MDKSVLLAFIVVVLILVVVARCLSSFSAEFRRQQHEDFAQQVPSLASFYSRSFSPNAYVAPTPPKKPPLMACDPLIDLGPMGGFAYLPLHRSAANWSPVPYAVVDASGDDDPMMAKNLGGPVFGSSNAEFHDVVCTSSNETLSLTFYKSFKDGLGVGGMAVVCGTCGDENMITTTSASLQSSRITLDRTSTNVARVPHRAGYENLLFAPYRNNSAEPPPENSSSLSFETQNVGLPGRVMTGARIWATEEEVIGFQMLFSGTSSASARPK